MILTKGIEVAGSNLEPMTWDEAVKACEALGDGWRLPTKDELNWMYEHKDEIGGFGSGWFWSSTQYNDFFNGWRQRFYDGQQGHLYYKNKKSAVRACRDVEAKTERAAIPSPLIGVDTPSEVEIALNWIEESKPPAINYDYQYASVLAAEIRRLRAQLAEGVLRNSDGEAMTGSVSARIKSDAEWNVCEVEFLEAEVRRLRAQLAEESARADKNRDWALGLEALLVEAKEQIDEAYKRGYSNGYARRGHDDNWDKVEANL